MLRQLQNAVGLWLPGLDLCICQESACRLLALGSSRQCRRLSVLPAGASGQWLPADPWLVYAHLQPMEQRLAMVCQGQAKTVPRDQRERESNSGVMPCHRCTGIQGKQRSWQTAWQTASCAARPSDACVMLVSEMSQVLRRGLAGKRLSVHRCSSSCACASQPVLIAGCCATAQGPVWLHDHRLPVSAGSR